jgi:hypothetical protein
MKKTRILYWVFTGLFAALMTFTAIPDIMMSKDAVSFMNGILGYPNYLIPFIGVAKILGSIVILVPGFPRLKEWAYAGLFFDLAGATFSVVSVAGFDPGMLFMLFAVTLFGLSYFFYHKLAGERALAI